MKRLVAGMTCFMFSAGCKAAPQSVEGKRVYFLGTGEYEAKLNTFAVTSAEAEQKALDYLKKKQPGLRKYALGEAAVILGDDYVFTLPEKDRQVALTGVYVNGQSGKVVQRESSMKIRLPENARHVKRFWLE